MKVSVLSNGKILVNNAVNISVLMEFIFYWGYRKSKQDRECSL